MTEVLPARQYRFGDLSGCAREIIAHHEERLAEVAALPSDSPFALGISPRF
ncbi:hypothetical protein AGRA3207_006101 [Actinomadura graeca]|uniref:Uncharacterized protein n=1 Tax=Actinomadura graeca TaxID=2750812 RepID=A0ABX8R0X9_9ACTN|nr:hypothetical protein [Actinomadura graeca]QXJ24719.1 hypothetical protein AGRA3207_006101 [Actinomadura graeca]